MSQCITVIAPKGQSKSILIVDDNVALRYTLGHWLRLLNYTVFEAATADEAMTLLASSIGVDFVVTDVNMPGTINGFELASHVKKNFPALKIIVVSGDDTHKEIKKENIPFFKKPYDLEVISAHIAKMLGDSDDESKVSQ